MLKHPVLASMGIAAVICIVIIGFWLAGARNVDEKPFIIFFGLLGFPFVWFAVWIPLNGLAWWADIKRGTTKED
jgi:hypothetical protein